jgi:hypothetical protein
MDGPPSSEKKNCTELRPLIRHLVTNWMGIYGNLGAHRWFRELKVFNDLESTTTRNLDAVAGQVHLCLGCIENKCKALRYSFV